MKSSYPLPKPPIRAIALVARTATLALFFAAIIAEPWSAAAQEPEPVRISRLRGELAGEFELSPEEVVLQGPPTIAIRPGAIVSLSAERGTELVDQLPDVRAVEQTAQDVELRDRVEIGEDLTLWRRLFGNEAPRPLFAGVQLDVTQVRILSLEEADRQRLKEFATQSRPALAAHRTGKELFAVQDVFVGQMQLEVFTDATDHSSLTPVLAGFSLRREENGPLTLTSDQEVSFAFRAMRLNFRAEPGQPPEVTFEKPQTTRQTASAWELAEAPRMAAAAPTSPAPADGHEVTVLYATCRAVQVEPVSTASRIMQFATTANGLGTIAGLVILLLLTLIGVSFVRRLNVLISVSGLSVAAVLFLAIAWVDARRQEAQAAKVTGIYNNKRGELRYGVSKVSVPKQRNIGELNTPFALYVIELPEDPEKHFVVTELAENREAFFAELKSKVAASDKRNAFVFIHGYNVPFADAVKRTAQLTVDLKFAGAPICYSWPSQGDLADYVQDSTNAEVAAYKLKQLLADLNEQSGAKEIHLVAHSMGNDVLTRALKELGKEALGQMQVRLSRSAAHGSGHRYRAVPNRDLAGLSQLQAADHAVCLVQRQGAQCVVQAAGKPAGRPGGRTFARGEGDRDRRRLRAGYRLSGTFVLRRSSARGGRHAPGPARSPAAGKAEAARKH